MGVVVYNRAFDAAPSFTAATNTSTRWIDGTAAGSTTNTNYGWGTRTITGSGSAQFDSSVFHSGAYSLMASTTAIASQIDVSNNPTSAVGGSNIIPALENSSYTITCWAKALANSGSATTGARIALSPRKSDGTSAGTSATITVGPSTVDWSPYSATLATPVQTQFLFIFLTIVGSDGAGTLIMDAWVDDIEIFGGAVSPNTGRANFQVDNGMSRSEMAN